MKIDLSANEMFFLAERLEWCLREMTLPVNGFHPAPDGRVDFVRKLRDKFSLLRKIERLNRRTLRGT